MARKMKTAGHTEQEQQNVARCHARQRELSDFEDTETLYQETAPPQYEGSLGVNNLRRNNAEQQARLTGDGRVTIDFNEQPISLSHSIVAEVQKQIMETIVDHPQPAPQYEDNSYATSSNQNHHWPPSLNIVIQLVGSRGDIQPFIALGLVLKTTYHHRVRIATHPIFKIFVERNGLEFFSIGGDPAELMAFMVRSPGLLPSLNMLRGEDVARHRKTILRMMEGCWRACVEPDDGLVDGEAGTGNEKENRKRRQRAFVADVIVANPPSFAHIHCAQKLGVPVHVMFTMPWTATKAFPHPLANIRPSSQDVGLINYVSYTVVETVLWQGLGSVINKFRDKVLGLEPLRLAFGSRIANRLKIFHTYCWSPSLIPKPQDWGSHISVAGFYFLPLTTGYTADSALVEFLASGSPPVYIGFGSIVVDDSQAMTNTIFKAIEMTGERALVSRGWSEIGSGRPPDNVFLVGDVPHDWLFPRVSCVVHHGGAGTTAAAMAAGKPSVIIPFFGDQPFWGQMVSKAGVGPRPILGKQLDANLLAAAIKQALDLWVVARARELGQAIISERGTEAGAVSLHRQVDMQSTKCSLASNRVAVWEVKKTDIRLSAFAATSLLNSRMLRSGDLKLHRHQEYDLESGPWDPITGVACACLGMVGNMTKSLGQLPVEVNRAIKANQDNGSASHGAVNIARATVAGVSKGIGQIILAGFRSPFEVTLAAARGFHNLPALYGDETLRPAERIDGIKSGLEAVGKEIGYSLYDGVAGLFVQPVRGARKDGVAGLAKGLGRGLGGIVFKPVAAVWGVAGYTYEGANKEMERLFGSFIEDYIALARLAQGSEEFANSSDKDVAEILQRWKGFRSK